MVAGRSDIVLGMLWVCGQGIRWSWIVDGRV